MIFKDTLVKLAALVILIAMLIALMVIGESLLIPMAWAFVFSFVIHPICEWMERKGISRSTAAIFATLLFCATSGLLLFYLIYESIVLIKEEAQLYEKISALMNSVTHYLEESWGFQVASLQENQKDMSSYSGMLKWIAKEISMIGKNLVTLTLIPMYMFFFLNYRDVLFRFVEKRFSGERQEKVNKFLQQSHNSIQSYLSGTLLLTIVSAVMSFVILLIFGVSHSFFFAIFIAVLNLVPFVGNLLAFAVVLIFVAITKDSGWWVLYVGIALYVSNMIQENVLRPKLVGSKMEMNAMMVFSAVIVGGMIWGVSGMVLFIPFLGVVKSLLENFEPLKSYAVFFETE